MELHVFFLLLLVRPAFRSFFALQVLYQMKVTRGATAGSLIWEMHLILAG
jgi:hypothetical protein